MNNLVQIATDMSKMFDNPLSSIVSISTCDSGYEGGDDDRLQGNHLGPDLPEMPEIILKSLSLGQHISFRYSQVSNKVSNKVLLVIIPKI